MLKLYYAPDNASLILRMALEEAGLEYEAILVDRRNREQKSAEYLAINPAGLIPTLITPDGPLAETGACLLWLCDTYPDAGLGPAINNNKRGMFLRWLFYISNTVHVDLIRIFYPERYVPHELIEGHHALMIKQLLAHFSILDDAVEKQPDLFKPPSILSFYIGALLRWAALYPVSAKRWLQLNDYPALRDLMIILEKQPCTHTTARAEGLGDTPFSAPKLPNPPEGSAL